MADATKSTPAAAARAPATPGIASSIVEQAGGDDAEMLQRAWRMAYVVLRWLPARAEAFLAQNDASLRRLDKMPPGEMYNAFIGAASNKTSRTDVALAAAVAPCTVANVIVKGWPIVVPLASQKYYATLKHATEYRKQLLDARTPDELCSTRLLDVDALNRRTPGSDSYFAHIEERVHALQGRITNSMRQLTESLSTVSPQTQSQTGYFKRAFENDELAQTTTAECFDIAELLFAGALLMYRVVDGADETVGRDFADAWGGRDLREIEQAQRTARDLSYHLYVLNSINRQTKRSLDDGVAYLNARPIVVHLPQGQRTHGYNLSDHLLSAVRFIRRRCVGRSFCFCAPVPGDHEDVGADGRTFRMRFMNPAGSMYTWRDNEWRRGRAKLIQAKPTPSGMVDLLRTGDATAVSTNRAQCEEFCEAGLDMAGLYDGVPGARGYDGEQLLMGDEQAKRDCTAACADRGDDPCFGERLRTARQRAADRTGRAKAVARLALDFYNADVPGCDRSEAFNVDMCRRRVLRACKEYPCGAENSDESVARFAESVCEPRSQWYEEFGTKCRLGDDATTPTAYQQKDSECLADIAKRKARDGTSCTAAVFNDERCRDNPLRCFMAATEEGWKKFGEVDDYLIVRNACKPVIERSRRDGFETKSMSEFDVTGTGEGRDLCEIARRILTETKNPKAPAALILRELYEKECNGMEAGNLRLLDLGSLQKLIDEKWESVYNPFAATHGTRFVARRMREVEAINQRKFTQIFDAVKRRGAVVDGGAGQQSPAKLLLRSLDLSCIALVGLTDFELNREKHRGGRIHTILTKVPELQRWGHQQLYGALGLAYAEVVFDYVLEVALPQWNAATEDAIIADCHAAMHTDLTFMCTNGEDNCISPGARRIDLFQPRGTNRLAPLLMPFVIGHVDRRMESFRISDTSKELAPDQTMTRIISIVARIFRVVFPREEGDGTLGGNSRDHASRLRKDFEKKRRKLDGNARHFYKGESDEATDALAQKLIDVSDGLGDALADSSSDGRCPLLERVGDVLVALSHDDRNKNAIDWPFWTRLLLACFVSEDFVRDPTFLDKQRTFLTRNTTRTRACEICLAINVLSLCNRTAMTPDYVYRLYVILKPSLEFYATMLARAYTEHSLVMEDGGFDEALHDATADSKKIRTLSDEYQDRESTARKQKTAPTTSLAWTVDGDAGTSASRALQVGVLTAGSAFSMYLLFTKLSSLDVAGAAATVSTAAGLFTQIVPLVGFRTRWMCAGASPAERLQRAEEAIKESKGMFDGVKRGLGRAAAVVGTTLVFVTGWPQRVYKRYFTADDELGKNKNTYAARLNSQVDMEKALTDLLKAEDGYTEDNLNKEALIPYMTRGRMCASGSFSHSAFALLDMHMLFDRFDRVIADLFAYDDPPSSSAARQPTKSGIGKGSVDVSSIYRCVSEHPHVRRTLYAAVQNSSAPIEGRFHGAVTQFEGRFVETGNDNGKVRVRSVKRGVNDAGPHHGPEQDVPNQNIMSALLMAASVANPVACDSEVLRPRFTPPSLESRPDIFFPAASVGALQSVMARGSRVELFGEDAGGDSAVLGGDPGESCVCTTTMQRFAIMCDAEKPAMCLRHVVAMDYLFPQSVNDTSVGCVAQLHRWARKYLQDNGMEAVRNACSRFNAFARATTASTWAMLVDSCHHQGVVGGGSDEPTKEEAAEVRELTRQIDLAINRATQGDERDESRLLRNGHDQETYLLFDDILQRAYLKRQLTSGASAEQSLKRDYALYDPYNTARTTGEPSFATRDKEDTGLPALEELLQARLGKMEEDAATLTAQIQELTLQRLELCSHLAVYNTTSYAAYRIGSYEARALQEEMGGGGGGASGSSSLWQSAIPRAYGMLVSRLFLSMLSVRATGVRCRHGPDMLVALSPLNDYFGLAKKRSGDSTGFDPTPYTAMMNAGRFDAVLASTSSVASRRFIMEDHAQAQVGNGRSGLFFPEHVLADTKVKM
jgi:hypothetical protein